MKEDRESNNSVRVTLKKSSSSGKIGYDVAVLSDGTLKQEDLDKIAEMSLKTALKVRQLLATGGM